MFELVDYISYELHDKESAIKIRDELIAFLRGMTEFTYRYSLDEHKYLKSLGIRKAFFKNYRVYLWIDELYKTVNILAVFHVFTNSEQHLKEMFDKIDISHTKVWE